MVVADKIEVRGVQTHGGTPNGLQHDTRTNSLIDCVAAPKYDMNANLFWWFPLTPDEF
jgi:hypothetical protein